MATNEVNEIIANMTREQLQAFCIWNDPNGCYSDDDCITEFGVVSSDHTYRAIIRDWADEQALDGAFFAGWIANNATVQA